MLFSCSVQTTIWYKAATNLHRAIWQNDLEKKLPNVAGCKGLKYLPPIEVKDLQLGELGCDVDAILFREEYSLALKKLEVCQPDLGGMVVLGHPGIGTGSL
jgi:hypothetical protein